MKSSFQYFLFFASILLFSFPGYSEEDLSGETDDAKDLRKEIEELKKENAALRAELESKSPPSSAASQGTALAPVAIPKNSPPEEKPKWTGNVSVGGSLDRGNTTAENLAIGGEVTLTTEDEKWKNTVNGTLGRTQGITTTQRINQSSQYENYFDPKWYFFLHEASTYDKLAGIQYRGVVGPGAGYHLIKTKEFTLDVELGVALEAQKIPEQDWEYTPRALGASNFEYKITSTTRIFLNARVLPNIQQPDDYLAEAHLGIETQITRPLSLTFTINDFYNSQPPDSFQKNDLNAITALVWKF